MKQHQEIDQYLATFRSHLGSLTLAQREEALSEIGAHIRDAVAESGDVSTVLTSLGSPEDLAAQYGDSALVQRATETASPVLLLRAALRLATKGVSGMLVFLCGFFGYIFALTIALIGFIKPFAPATTGLWLRNGKVIVCGAMVQVPPAPAHEILGWWCVPLALVLGTVAAAITTAAIILCLRLSQKWQARLGRPSHVGRLNFSRISYLKT